MKINYQTAMQFWEAIFGDELLVEDCFGDLIYKEDFGDTETMRIRPGETKSYNYGWDIDHILPLSKNGSNDNNNLEPMHWQNNRDKSDQTSFEINEEIYEIIKCKVSIDGYKGYGIRVKDTKERVDWKAVYQKHF